MVADDLRFCLESRSFAGVIFNGINYLKFVVWVEIWEGSNVLMS